MSFLSNMTMRSKRDRDPESSIFAFRVVDRISRRVGACLRVHYALYCDDCKLECTVAFGCESRQRGYCEAVGGSLAGGPEGKELGWRYTVAFGGYV
jgi:hypothetical protein